jgi:hypothetical protein
MRLKRNLAVALVVVLSGCETTNRALRLREQARAAAARGHVSWAGRWKEVQGAEQWKKRLSLAFELSTGKETSSPVTDEEIAASCAADARALETANADVETLGLGAQWARERMGDARLYRVLICRAADRGHAAATHFQCAVEQAKSRAWTDAVPHLQRAFDGGDASLRCDAVRLVERSSPQPAADLATWPAEVVRQCRLQQPRDSEEEAAMGASSAPERPASPSGALSDVASTPLKGGLQLTARLGGDSTGTSLGVEVGYSSASFGLGLAPVFSYLTVGEGTTASSALALGLGVSLSVYFAERRAQRLVGFLRPEVVLGQTLSTGLEPRLLFKAGVAVGAEYLLTGNLGFSAELGASGGTALVGPATGVRVSVGGTLGVVLHH